jgi:hypothetical protein
LVEEVDGEEGEEVSYSRTVARHKVCHYREDEWNCNVYTYELLEEFGVRPSVMR